ncbi:hypothetical protein V6N13_143897 [Hibiscus sabdariffa]
MPQNSKEDEDEDEELDIVVLGFEFMGDLKGFASVSDGMHGMVNESLGNSAPVLLPMPEAAATVYLCLIQMLQVDATGCGIILAETLTLLAHLSVG